MAIKIYKKIGGQNSMFIGEFAGELASKQQKKVLILGESHHGNPTEWEQKNRTTTCVVHDYLEQYRKPDGREKCYRFFERIVSSFGYDCETQREEFWSKVYFGNYVSDVLCGIADSKAKVAIAKNHDKYNTELFQFINNNNIDVVFCFSRRVWGSLPKYINGDGRTHREDTGSIGSQNDYIKTCVYVPGARKGTPALNKELKVYCMRHPSARSGFKPENYQAILHTVLEEILQ